MLSYPVLPHTLQCLHVGLLVWWGGYPDPGDLGKFGLLIFKLRSASDSNKTIVSILLPRDMISLQVPAVVWTTAVFRRVPAIV